MPDSALPERPGWYSDPYDSGRQRYFDGSRWTLHAVDELVDPDEAVQRNWSMHSSEELRRQEWEDRFPPWDAVTNRTSEFRWDRGRNWLLQIQTSHRSPWLIGVQVVLVVLGIVGLVVHVATASGSDLAWAAGELALFIVAGTSVARSYLRKHRSGPFPPS